MLCPLCNKQSQIVHTHHIFPVAWGGLDIPENKIDICESCHNALHSQAREIIKYVNHKNKGDTIQPKSFINDILTNYSSSPIREYINKAVEAYFKYKAAKSQGYMCETILKRTLLTFNERDLHKLQYYRKLHKFKSIEDYIIWLMNKNEGTIIR